MYKMEAASGIRDENRGGEKRWRGDVRIDGPTGDLDEVHVHIPFTPSLLSIIGIDLLPCFVVVVRVVLYRRRKLCLPTYLSLEFLILNE